MAIMYNMPMSAIFVDMEDDDIMRADAFSLSRTGWIELIDLWIFNETDRAILKRRLLDAGLMNSWLQNSIILIGTSKPEFTKRKSNFLSTYNSLKTPLGFIAEGFFFA